MINRAKHLKLAMIALGASLAFSATAMAATTTSPAKSQAKPAKMSSWIKDCRKLKSGEINCITAINIIVTKPRKQRLAGVAMLSTSKTKKNALLIALPLGAQLKLGYTLKIDKGAPLKGEFSVCLPDGCHSQINANADLVKKMKTGQNLNLIYVNHLRQKINVAVPLSGFTKAYDSKTKIK